MKSPSLSLVIPVYNEAESLPILQAEIEETLNKLPAWDAEIIYVNDGSRDESAARMHEFAQRDARVREISFRRNYGQTAALSCGMREAQGEIIIPMDADLQNDPADIVRLLEKIQEGFSCVSGWRKDRWQDAYWRRRVPSEMANRLISWMTGTPLHDYGCTMKAYRREVIQGINLYGEMHRFIPAYAAWQGASVTEIVLHDRPRTFGQSNYGFSRVFKVLLDLIVVKFLFRYFNRPMHFFGTIGFVSLSIGSLSLAASIVLKFMGLRSFIQTPLPVIGMMFVVLGVQFILSGLLAEVLMRTYYESQGRRPYETNK